MPALGEGLTSSPPIAYLPPEHCDECVVGYSCHVNCVYELLHLLKLTLIK